MPSSRQSSPNSNRSSLVSAASGSTPSLSIATIRGKWPAAAMRSVNSRITACFSASDTPSNSSAM